MVVSANIHGHGKLLPDMINQTWLKIKTNGFGYQLMVGIVGLQWYLFQ